MTDSKQAIVPLLQKNLTPFFWGPKATSRRPPQVEMALCVRGVFRLEPGKPVEAIEDLMDQGFMSGNQWAEDDPDRPVTSVNAGVGGGAGSAHVGPLVLRARDGRCAPSAAGRRDGRRRAGGRRRC